MECHIDGCSEEHISEDVDQNPVCRSHWMDYLRGRGPYAPEAAEPAQEEESGEGADVAPEGPEAEPPITGALAEANAEADATDAAIQLANKFALDLRDVTGTGGRTGEKIVKRDVKDAL